MKHDTFLILKLLIKILKELVVGQGLFSAKSPCLLYKFVYNTVRAHGRENHVF